MGWIGEDVHSKRWDAVQSSTPHPARQHHRTSATLQAKACANAARTARHIPPFPFLDAIKRARPAQCGNTIARPTPLHAYMDSCMVHAHAQTINVSGCPANLSVDKEDVHDALHAHGRPSSRRRLRVAGRRRHGRHCGRVCPAAARADHPHGAHRARRPSSAGTHTFLFTPES